MMARVYDEELRDRARAEESYLYVLQIDDIDLDALAALDRIYDQAGMFSELAEILKRRIAVVDETELLVELLALARRDHGVETLGDLYGLLDRRPTPKPRSAASRRVHVRF